MKLVKLIIKYISCHSNLIFSILSYISHPRKSLISTLFNYLQISDLYSTNCEIWNFKFNLNWCSRILLSLLTLNTWEPKLGSHQKFLSSWELFYTPYHTILVRHILDSSNIRFKNWGINIRRHRYVNFNIVSDRFGLKLSFCFH